MRKLLLTLIIAISAAYSQFGYAQWGIYCAEEVIGIGVKSHNPPMMGFCNGNSMPMDGFMGGPNICWKCFGKLAPMDDVLNSRDGKQNAEIAAVRKELATQASDLKEWRALALTAVLDRIDQMPGKFAANEAVTKAVGAQVAAFLMKDPEFMAKLREVLSSSKTVAKKK